MHARNLLHSYVSSHITVNWTLYSLSITTINCGKQIPAISLRNDPQVLTVNGLTVSVSVTETEEDIFRCIFWIPSLILEEAVVVKDTF